MSDAIKDGLTLIWASDFVQKNPSKAYKTLYASEYQKVAAFLNGGPEPMYSNFSKLGKGLCQIEIARRQVDEYPPPSWNDDPPNPPPPPPPPPTGTAFVSTTGSDSTGDGSQTNPWRSVKKACDTVTSGTISVGAGTFVESATCSLKTGVSLVGAGMGSTTIQPASAFTPLIQMNGSGQTLSDLTLDGVNKTRSNHGVILNNSVNARILRCNIHHFVGTFSGGSGVGGGIQIAGGSGIEVAYCTLTDNANTVDYCSGDLALANHSGAKIHDCTIRDGHGYCIKKTDSGGTITNCEFYNLDVAVTASTVSGIAWEFESLNAVNCRIHHCTIAGELSLTDASGGPLPSGYTWRVDHNRFLPNPSGEWCNPIEFDHHSGEIDHNYSTASAYFFANFRDDKLNNLVHHNVVDSNFSAASFLVMTSAGYSGIQLYKNTVVVRSSPPNVISFGTAPTSGSVYDNLFWKSSGSCSFGSNLGNLSISHNAFYGVTSTGSSSIAANAQSIPDTGSFAIKYTPPSGNPAASVGAFADGAWSDVGVQ